MTAKTMPGGSANAGTSTSLHELTKKYFKNTKFFGGPNGNRTRVSGVRGQRPRPLDDGTVWIRIIAECKV